MNPEYPYQPQQPQQPPQPQPVNPAQSYTVPGSVPQVPPYHGYAPIPPANTPPVYQQSKPPKLWVILSIVFIITTLAAGGLAAWSYINYNEQKTDVDGKIEVAKAAAVKEQADKDAAAFLEKEKQPNRQFVGPDDYGRLSFDYPKTWSVYVARDANEGGNYEAYFNPGVVPPVQGQGQQFSLRVTIEQRNYDTVLDSYKQKVTVGELSSTAVKADEQNGTRLDGKFTEDIVGSAVIFKIRDKTVTIRSDANTFKGDFDALIQTITFNK